MAAGLTCKQLTPNCFSMDRYCVAAGKKVKLDSWDPDEKSLCEDGKEAGQALLAELKEELYELQVKFFAESKRKLLVVLQGMDTSGKDGTIRHVFGGLDPQGIRVATFAKPSETELAHDYLWRIHQETPINGEVVIFNRSHYEDVLAVRVRKLRPKSVWAKRFGHINAFEQMLADEGTTLIKLFLHISFEEQRERLVARQNTPRKQWKLIPQDVEDRKLWPDYIKAYEDAIERTSTPYAPWQIIPANRKWYRNLVVARLMRDTLRKLDPQYPEPVCDVSKIKIK